MALEDEESFFLAGRKFRCLDTPGHARHHMCIVDEATGGVFTGDTFGLSYRETDGGAKPFLFPTTTPRNSIPMRSSDRSGASSASRPRRSI